MNTHIGININVNVNVMGVMLKINTIYFKYHTYKFHMCVFANNAFIPCIFVYMCVGVCLNVRMYVSVCLCLCDDKYIHTQKALTQTHIENKHARIYMYIHIYKF